MSMTQLGIVKRNIVRADKSAVDMLSGFSVATIHEAMGRAGRIGQLRPVTVYRLVSKGSIEERIIDLHHDKRALADSILAEGDASALPSTEDLVALIRGE